MDFQDVRYEVENEIATVQLDRPQARNAQSHSLLDELVTAFQAALDDPGVKLILLRGSGGNFSAGHDIGGRREGEGQVAPSGDEVDDFFRFRKYNLDVHLWMRNVTKPTIAMVEGWCINGGWELAASMDVVYAGESAKFIASQMEFFTQPWDIGVRKAKEMLFESRQLGAQEAMELGFVTRVFPDDELERETYNYAIRCTENSMGRLRTAKMSLNHAQDIMGFTRAIEAGFADWRMRSPITGPLMAPGKQRIINVDLAMQHARGERYGQTPGPSD